MKISAKLFGALTALLLIAAACSSDEAEGDVTTTTEAVADEGAATTTAPADTASETEPETEVTEPVVRPELSILAVSFTNNTVTVRNDGAEAVELEGLFLCNRPSYTAAEPGTIEPGGTFDIDASVLVVDAAGGEFGIYATQSFANAGDLLAYVQWGHGEHGRASVAFEAGLITEGEFIDNAGEDITVG